MIGAPGCATKALLPASAIRTRLTSASRAKTAHSFRVGF